MKNSKTTILTVGAALISASFIATPNPSRASPEFLVYEGRNAIHEGQGGEKKIVEGVDFWFNGEPPRRFKVLGAISDRRLKTGIYGMIRMSGLQTDIAKAAIAAGGDAVIMEGEGDDVLGMSGFGSDHTSGWAGSGGFSANSFGSSFVAPVKAHVSRYIVVKYLLDAVAPSPVDPAVSFPPQPLNAVAPTTTPAPGSADGKLP